MYVSNLSNMREIFFSCKKYNQDISQLDVYNVTDMSDMFMRCKIKEKRLTKVHN